MLFFDYQHVTFRLSTLRYSSLSTRTRQCDIDGDDTLPVATGIWLSLLKTSYTRKRELQRDEGEEFSSAEEDHDTLPRSVPYGRIYTLPTAI